VEILVTARDRWNNTCECTDAEARNFEVVLVELTNLVQSCSGPYVSLTFIPHLAGEDSLVPDWSDHPISVVYKGSVIDKAVRSSLARYSAEILESPKTIRVFAGPISNATTTAAWPALGEASVAQSFAVTARDLDGNLIACTSRPEELGNFHLVYANATGVRWFCDGILFVVRFTV